jgi:hypothetical protein
MFNNEAIFQMKFGRSLPKPEELLPLRARKLFSFADKTSGYSFVRLDVGPADDPLLWLDNVNRTHVRDEEYRRDYKALVASGNARFKIVHYHGGTISEVPIAEIPRAEVLVQPLPDDRYLIASCRAQTGLQNAWIFDAGGVLVNQFRIGDDIVAMQTTLSGNIWTGYNDEGATGRDPLSTKLVTCFDKDGTLLFPDSYVEEFGYWCEGLNVESENCVWVVPSPEGLVKIENFAISQVFKGYSEGSSIFAIWGNYACWAPTIFCWLGIDFFVISELDSEERRFFQIVDEAGERIKPEWCAARGSKMYFTIKHDVYVFDLKEVVG